MSGAQHGGEPDLGRDRPEEPTGPTIRDRRRIDPVTGEVRPIAAGETGGRTADGPGLALPGAGSGPIGGDAEIVGLQAELAERTADLQRVQAEYLNYRRRVERDREAVRDHATANAITALLPVLDDIGRARDHDELVGGFRSVADAIEQALTKLGLVSFGQVGDPFDPNRHEALIHAYSEDVTETTCTQVFAPGYQFGDRVLRPAKVAVADPMDHSDQPPAGDEATVGEPDGEPDEQ
jgi:molecular chaperone GrpE